jgi:hypothetical protein
MLIDHLPRPASSRGTLPEWLRAMPATAFSAVHDREIRTLKQCPPVIDAMTYGLMVFLPCDIMVDRGAFSWDWAIPNPATDGHPRSPLSFHTASQVAGSPFGASGLAILKFNSFWTIEVEDGWSLFATHPVNREDLPFRLVTGLVDSDRFHNAGINFPAVWVEPDFCGVLPRGTPVAQCFAVPRTSPQLVFEAFDEARQTSYAKTVDDVLSMPGVYRKRFRARRGRATRE